MPPTGPSPEEIKQLYPVIADALFDSVPDDWAEILLQIQPVGAEIQFEITGPGGCPNLRVPDDSLWEPAMDLYALFVRASCPFARCDFRLRWDEAREDWRFTADFVYPTEA